MRFNNRACALMDIPDLPQGAFEHIGNGKIKPQGGGGGFIGDFVENTLGSAGDFVENTVSSAGDYVGDQIQEIIDDPVKAAAKVAAVASGNAWAIPLIDGIDTIEEGGTIGEGLLSAGKSYVGQQVGAELGSQFGGGGYGTGEDFNMGEFNAGEDFNMGVSLGDADIQEGGFYGGGATPQATIIPGELGDIILDANGNVVLSSGSDILPGSTGFSITPKQALQALRSSSSLLGGQQQPMPQQQMMIGNRQANQYGGVDYSGLLNLLTPRMAVRNPNSLLG
jgi:hypothetical protein